MRPTFGREYIENEFRRIAAEVSDGFTVYLIGGGALAVRDLKDATKDIDVVVTAGEAYGKLWTVLKDLRYEEIQSLPPDYQALGATSCIENEDGCRFDIFNQQVANKLVLTEGMCDRSESFLQLPQLTVRLVSNEDIFLFKLIAGRDEDIEDVNTLVQAGLNYEVVQAELDTQIDRLGDDQIATFANETLIELEERYGVTTPIDDQVRDLTTRYYQGLEVIQALDGPTTLDDLADELELNIDDLRNRIAYLVEFDRIKRDGETVRPTE